LAVFPLQGFNFQTKASHNLVEAVDITAQVGQLNIHGIYLHPPRQGEKAEESD
jgi:hypothetical protein